MENKQIPLASNAVTNDTDNLASNTQTGVKRLLAEPKDFESIKEVDENNESFDARKKFEQMDPQPSNLTPDIQLEKRVVSDGDYQLDFKQKHYGKKLQGVDMKREIQHSESIEEDLEEGEANMLFVEQKFCTVCNIEQPLRSKH